MLDLSFIFIGDILDQVGGSIETLEEQLVFIVNDFMDVLPVAPERP